MKIQLASRFECTGCMVCTDACTHKAIDIIIADDGHYYPQIEKSKCVGCGVCMKNCPIVSNFSYQRTDKGSKPYAAWAKDNKIRSKSSSGGAFAAIAKQVLTEGGIVIGVALENSIARHIAIESISELYKLQGSKYQQSKTTGIYQQTLAYLRTGRKVLFSGTACQIAGLYTFLNQRTFENLVTVDLICGGVPSRLPIDKFLNQKDYVEIVSYRDKVDGWGRYCLTAINKSGKMIRKPLNGELVISSFSSLLTDRYSCYDCKFSGLFRKADITLADFWGDKDFEDEHKAGVSLIIIHSLSGRKIVCASDLELHETTWDKCMPYNPRLVYGKVPMAKYRLERRLLGYFWKRKTVTFLIAVYGGIYPNKLWYPYKFFKYFVWRFNMYVMNKKLEKITKILK